jgi:hypothetical protein
MMMRTYCIVASVVFFLFALRFAIGEWPVCGNGVANTMAGLVSMGFSIGSGLSLLAAARVKKD